MFAQKEEAAFSMIKTGREVLDNRVKLAISKFKDHKIRYGDELVAFTKLSETNLKTTKIIENPC